MVDTQHFQQALRSDLSEYETEFLSLVSGRWTEETYIRGLRHLAHKGQRIESLLDLIGRANLNGWVRR